MSKPSFVHLHVHSEYSLLDGACRTKELAREAARLGMPAVALTDHGNLFGAIEFYKNCRAEGVKPLIGCEVYLAPGSRKDRKAKSARDASTHLLLLAKNATGYHHLMKLVSSAHLEGQYYHPRVDKEILAQWHEGLIATSACLKGEIAQAILAHDTKAVEKSIADFCDIFGKEDFYLEMADHGLEAQKEVNQALQKYAKSFGLKLIASNDVHYLKPEHSAAHEVLLCIQTGTTLSDPNRMRYPSSEFYFKSPAQMAKLFADTPEALYHTLEIAEKCDLEIELGVNKFPKFDPPPELTNHSYFRQLCEEGLKKRYPDHANYEDIRHRLLMEMEVIESTGFVDYFLITWDFIHHAKSQGIPVGLGRGSAAGSIVAYVLEITDLDPLHYALYFERFLNPERISPPDIDIDFCYNRRPEVIEYVRKKYGDQSVAQIITFGTLGAKMAVRDVARVLGLDYSSADRLAKMIPFDPKITLERALRENPEFQRAYDEEEPTRQVIDYAKTLEGLTRQAGVHAAGVVIADGDLTKNLPITRDESGGIVTQYAMDPLSDIGALKMDFLGLKTLTVIQDCLDLVEANQGIRIAPGEIPLDNEATYHLLQKAQNVGLFQVESAGMCDLCRRLKPSNIEDIIALVALYRPGPMENIPAYEDRKLGKVPIQYDHPLLEPILKDTYGVMIYQEQVMQAARALAGYTLGGADMLRRAMGKKKKEVMDAEREKFVRGCYQLHHISEKKALDLFTTLEKFAGYGFNKAHSACYGVLAYQTAYLKTNYRVEFMASLLSNDMDNTDKIALFIAEAKQLGITVLAPNINESSDSFQTEEGHIRFGLAAIKNVGREAVKQLVIERQKNGPFTSLVDLCVRVGVRQLNRKTLESLVKSGAMDAWSPSRKALIEQIDRTMAEAQSIAKDKEAGQGSLLDLLGPLDQPPAPKLTKSATQKTNLPSVEEEWPLSEKLGYEKDLLGFYLSGHPLDDFAPEIHALQIHTIEKLSSVEANTATRLAGILAQLDVRTTREGKRPWARFFLEDQTGTIEVLCFPDNYAALPRIPQVGEVLTIIGHVDRRDELPKLRLQEIKSLEEARTQLYRRLTLQIPLSQFDTARLSQLQNLVLDYPGKLPLALRCKKTPSQWVDLLANEAYSVHFSEDFRNKLHTFLGLKGYTISAATQLPQYSWGGKKRSKSKN